MSHRYILYFTYWIKHAWRGLYNIAKLRAILREKNIFKEKIQAKLIQTFLIIIFFSYAFLISDHTLNKLKPTQIGHIFQTWDSSDCHIGHDLECLIKKYMNQFLKDLQTFVKNMMFINVIYYLNPPPPPKVDILFTQL